MWQKTKHGLYRQFNFENFKEAWVFMTRVAKLAEEYQHHPRWENEWNVVQIWLITHEGNKKITEKDYVLSKAIDKAFGAEVPQAEKLTDLKVGAEKIKVFADGGSRGNPGPSASGYVIKDETGKVLVSKGVYVGVTTNNQAEYQALKMALEEACAIGASVIEVYMDSLLVINQMKGVFKVKNRDLWPIHDSIKQIVSKFKQVSFQHVPRELNKMADTEVNKALDNELAINTQQP